MWGSMKDRVVLLIVPVLFLLGVYTGRREPVRHVVTGGEAYFAPGVQCENRIIEEITKAQDIDIAIYSLTSPRISNALIGAQKRGADIRIVADRGMAGNKHSQIDELADAGIPVRKSRKHKIEHNKFAIFDGDRIVTGSYNWTKNSANSNSENCIFLDVFGPDYSKRFEYLWDLYGISLHI